MRFLVQGIRRLFREMLILALAFFAGVYLLIPTLGIFELIPDAVPFLGSLDEGAATLILLNTLNYYGIDLTNLYGTRRNKQKKRRVLRVRRRPKPPESIPAQLDDPPE